MNTCLVRLGSRRTLVPCRSIPLLVLSLALAATATTGAQLVTPKTVPLHQDEQFAIFPSAYAGMAGVSIALDDTLADPFANPALATRVRRGAVFVTPYVHGVSAGHGGGNTLPFGAAGAAGSWAGTMVVALQQINQPATTIGGIPQPASNQYGSFVLARRLEHGISVGASAYVAGLNAMDDLDLLYAGSDRLTQSGTLRDYRLGFTKDWGERRFDAVLVTNRTNVSQNVHYTFYTRDSVNETTRITQFAEDNVDETTIWGAHTQYVQPVGDGWRVGWLATANRLSHPKIPDYRIQNIPRDPGNTTAFNIGAGASHREGADLVAIDVIMEPMYSRTWGTAANDTAVASGGVLHAGERTVDNRFTFSNVHLRFGASHDFAVSRDSATAWTIQYGLGAYVIKYRLRQDDHVQQTNRIDDRAWTEWTPSIGLSHRTRAFTVRYNYHRTCGPSACIDIGTGDRVTVPASGGIIAAPAEGRWIEGATVHVHQLMITVPIR